MNPIAWLIGLVLPACGFTAAGGLPTAPLMDVSHLVRPSTPNTALAAPEGFNPVPDIVTPPYRITANRLFGLIQDVAAAQPRTWQAAVYPDHYQAHYVARSLVFNFPDLITAQVTSGESGSSTLILYSRSVYGHSDLGVNHRRVDAWLAALRSKLPPDNER